MLTQQQSHRASLSGDSARALHEVRGTKAHVNSLARAQQRSRMCSSPLLRFIAPFSVASGFGGALGRAGHRAETRRCLTGCGGLRGQSRPARP